jgi:hypothetical protein
VTAGVRVSEIAAERRSLEDVVLSVTGSGSDRFGGPARSDDPPPGRSPAAPATPGAGGAASAPAAAQSGEPK